MNCLNFVLIQILRRLTRIKAIKKKNFNFIVKIIRMAWSWSFKIGSRKTFKNLSSKHNKAMGTQLLRIKKYTSLSFNFFFIFFCFCFFVCVLFAAWFTTKRICMKLIFNKILLWFFDRFRDFSLFGLLLCQIK